MALARKDDELHRALARLREGSGSVPVSRDGRVLSPEQLERLEDVQDTALLQSALDRGAAADTVSLDDLATSLGIDLARA